MPTARQVADAQHQIGGRGSGPDRQPVLLDGAGGGVGLPAAVPAAGLHPDPVPAAAGVRQVAGLGEVDAVPGPDAQLAAAVQGQLHRALPLRPGLGRPGGGPFDAEPDQPGVGAAQHRQVVRAAGRHAVAVEQPGQRVRVPAVRQLRPVQEVLAVRDVHRVGRPHHAAHAPAGH